MEMQFNTRTRRPAPPLSGLRSPNLRLPIAVEVSHGGGAEDVRPPRALVRGQVEVDGPHPVLPLEVVAHHAARHVLAWVHPNPRGVVLRVLGPGCGAEGEWGKRARERAHADDRSNTDTKTTESFENNIERE